MGEANEIKCILPRCKCGNKETAIGALRSGGVIIYYCEESPDKRSYWKEMFFWKEISIEEALLIQVMEL